MKVLAIKWQLFLQRAYTANVKSIKSRWLVKIDRQTDRQIDREQTCIAKTLHAGTRSFYMGLTSAEETDINIFQVLRKSCK
jgi:hypothetical protein